MPKKQDLMEKFGVTKEQDNLLCDIQKVILLF